MKKQYYIWNQELGAYIRAYKVDIKFLENLKVIEDITCKGIENGKYYQIKKVKNQ